MTPDQAAELIAVLSRIHTSLGLISGAALGAFVVFLLRGRQ